MSVLSRKTISTKQVGRSRRTRRRATAAHVRLVRPSGTRLAQRRGQRLAALVRKELANVNGESLDEVMSRLRGRAWS